MANEQDRLRQSGKLASELICIKIPNCKRPGVHEEDEGAEEKHTGELQRAYKQFPRDLAHREHTPDELRALTSVNIVAGGEGRGHAKYLPNEEK